MTRVVRLGVAALLLAAPATLTGCGEDDAPAARGVGEPVAMREPPSGASSASVLLPTGRLEVTVAEPMERVAPDDTATLEPVSPADGDSVVPVGLSFDVAGAPWHRRLAFPAEEATVRLVVGEHSYEVGTPYTVGDGTTIAPAGDPGWFVPVRGTVVLDDIEVVVGYDGVEQRVDAASGEVDAGAAAGLATLPETAEAVPCPQQGWRVEPALQVRLDCAISAAARTPYWPGAGWAEDGAGWWVVSVDELRVLDATRAGASYRVASITDRSTLDGVDPLRPLRRQEPPRDYVAGGVLVFPVDGDAPRLRLELEVGLELDDPGPAAQPPDRLTVTARTDLPLTSN